MRILSSLAFRAIAGTATAAALVLALASVTGHTASQPAQHTFKLANKGHMMCPVCG